jgi:hypothetical protein
MNETWSIGLDCRHVDAHSPHLSCKGTLICTLKRAKMALRHPVPPYVEGVRYPPKICH